MKSVTFLSVLFLLVMSVALAGCTVNFSPQVGIPQTTVPPAPPATGTTAPVTPVATVTTVTTIPVAAVTTVVPVSSTASPGPVTWKSVDLAITLPNVYPVYGFRMDYPSDWSYNQDHSRDWRAGYNFTSPDGNSQVLVYVDDTSGTAGYWYSLTKWSDNVIRDMKTVYCLGNDAKPTPCTASQNSRDYHHLYLAGNDPVVIQGAFEARRLIFKSNDDRNFGEQTIYVIHAGNMEGYNFTVPDHYEVGVKAPGPVWDYGIGGQGYLISFHAPSEDVDSTRDIFSHMINSFRVTP